MSTPIHSDAAAPAASATLSSPPDAAAPTQRAAAGCEATAALDDAPVLRWLGQAAYRPTFEAMQTFTDARTAATPDEIWLVEHLPVYTLGQAGNPAHLLTQRGDVELVRVDRGGQITYHGPGQVVAYLLIDLRRRGLMVREFVQRIEQAVIDTLAAYNLRGERHAGAPGIYLAEGPLTGAKIAALGLKIRHGCSYHGVSLNVQMDLRPFDDINPCGYAGLQTVDMALSGVNAGWREVAQTLAARLAAHLPAMSCAQQQER